MKKLITVIALSFLFPISKSFSQPFDSTKDHEKSTYTDNNSEIIEYPKHILYAMLDSTLLTDTSYLNNVINFVNSKFSKIKYLTLSELQSEEISSFLSGKNIQERVRTEGYVTLGSIKIRLADTIDALNAINVFLSSGFFTSVHFGIFVYQNIYPAEPNDFYWSRQWCFKQREPIHSLTMT